jgi:hypothetical protein
MKVDADEVKVFFINWLLKNSSRTDLLLRDRLKIMFLPQTFFKLAAR